MNAVSWPGIQQQPLVLHIATLTAELQIQAEYVGMIDLDKDIDLLISELQLKILRPRQGVKAKCTLPQNSKNSVLPRFSFVLILDIL